MAEANNTPLKFDVLGLAHEEAKRIANIMGDHLELAQELRMFQALGIITDKEVAEYIELNNQELQVIIEKLTKQLESSDLTTFPELLKTKTPLLRLIVAAMKEKGIDAETLQRRAKLTSLQLGRLTVEAAQNVIKVNDLQNIANALHYDLFISFRDTEIPEDLPLWRIQGKYKEWTAKQPFANASDEQIALGIAEEAGEFCHSILKMCQGIRGTKEKHMEDAEDAIGDIVNFCMHFCNKHGLSLSDIIRKTSSKVMKRDWSKDLINGGETPDE